MADPYVGEIRMFAGNFTPVGWMFCEGQLLSIAENETLFQLIGTTYGGDGQTTFALPDLRGRLPLHQGNGFSLAQVGGAEEVTLTVSQLPAHSHAPLGQTATGTRQDVGGATAFASSPLNQFSTSPPNVDMKAGLIAPTGGSQPHNNMQPYLCVSFIISLFGIFPSQT